MGNVASTLRSASGEDEASSPHTVPIEITPYFRAGMLGDDMHAAYQVSGQPAHLDAAIKATRRSVDLSPEPVDPRLLFLLASRLDMRYDLLKRVEDLNDAIICSQRALKLTPFDDDDESRPALFHFLGGSLAIRWLRLGSFGDLDAAIRATRSAVALAHDGHPDKPRWLRDHGNFLMLRYEKTSQLEDIDAAISAHDHALRISSARGNPDPSHFSSLGRSLYMRFQGQETIGDLQRSIAMFARGIELTPDDHHSEPLDLVMFGSALRARFGCTHQSDDIEEAISVQRQAIELTPEGHHSKHVWYHNLAQSMLTRFEHTNQIEDIDACVSAYRCVIEHIPEEDPERALYFCSFGGALFQRFRRTGSVEDINEAVSVLEFAGVLASAGRSEDPLDLYDLGCALRERHKLLGRLDDIERAVQIHGRALRLTADDQSETFYHLAGLGSSLHFRFLSLGKVEDLHQAISTFHRAIALTRKGLKLSDDSKSGLYTSLGCALHSLSEFTGMSEHVDSSVTAHQRSFALWHDHSRPSIPAQACNYGNALRSRYERHGRLEDIQHAIELHTRAVQDSPGEHPQTPWLLTNLGNSLMVRYERTKSTEDILSGISAHEKAVDLTPDDHNDKPAYMMNVGQSLCTYYDNFKVVEFLDRSISAFQRANELTPDTHPDKPVRLSGLGNSLRKRFMDQGSIQDIECALSTLRLAIEMTPNAHSEKPSRIYEFGLALYSLYKASYSKDPHDLDEVISYLQRAEELMPEEWPRPNAAIYCECLEKRFEHSQTQTNFDAATSSYATAAARLSEAGFIRLFCATQCAHLHSMYPMFSSSESLLSAHSRVFTILPEIVWLGHGIDRRYRETAALAKLTTAAVSSAVKAGALDKAVEWLETGRSLIWSQILILRSSLDGLAHQHPELAQSLRAIRSQLQQSGHVPSWKETNASDLIHSGVLYVMIEHKIVINRAADRYRDLVVEYERLLAEVRACDGFQDFLYPRKFSALISSLTQVHGLVVFINTHSSRRDALILSGNGSIATTPLPCLSAQRAEQFRTAWTDLLGQHNVRQRGVLPRHQVRRSKSDLFIGLLKSIWLWIISPIIQAIGLTVSKDGENLPHITWCPTGPITQLPLHAAGVYDEESGPRVFDFAVSSYTSSLSALCRCYENNMKRDLTQPPSVLVVTQPATPGYATLPEAEVEGRRLSSTLHELKVKSEVLSHERATVETVRNAIGQYPWVHLACHGLQNPEDAIQSSFALYDGPLSLADLMKMVVDDAELAFLSACQTAAGDDGNPEESMHLAAGMLALGFEGVVATMWSIGDADAPVVVEAYYKALLRIRGSDTASQGGTGAAYALHEAVRHLRTKVGEKEFVKWAPFVHFGA